MLTFRDYGSQMIGERLDKMLSLVERVREGEDIEAIHDMRVASRRLRAAFSVFAPAFPYRRYTEMEREVRNITSALSEARELDVLLSDLRALETKLARNQRGSMERLAEQVAERRRSLDPVVLAALARVEAIDLREDLAFIVSRLSPGDSLSHRNQDAPFREGKGDGTFDDMDEEDGDSLEEQFLKELSLRVAALVRLGAHAGDPSHVVELHEMRIAAKKLRYTMELFAPFRDKWFSAAIERVRVLQEALGTIHDIDVMIPRLLAHARRDLKQGVDEQGIGAYGVDLDGVAGLLRACSLKRADRDAAHGRLVKEWDAVNAAGLLRRIVERPTENLEVELTGNGVADSEKAKQA